MNEGHSQEKNGDATIANHGLRVYSDITQLIASPENPTPLVRVNKLVSARGFRLYLKLERFNPFGSVKDRIAREMLTALDAGNRTVVEPTSGNTGIAMVGLANALGIPMEIAVPRGIPEEKKVLLRFLGAKVIEADDALCPLFPSEGARGMVNALVNSPATKDKYVSPNQYENQLNVLAHYRGTGPEIWRQTEGKVDYFFAGLGTCGTITGVGRYLKERNPGVKVVAVEPASSNHRLPGLKRITGLAEEFVPKILERSVIDDVVAAGDDDAYRTAADLARKEGILVGPTTGAIVYAALRYAETHTGVAVAISPDDALKYASFYSDFLRREAEQAKETEIDICGLICPLSKVKAIEVLDRLQAGETARIVVGDSESLKSIVLEMKERGLKPAFKQEGEARFVLTVTM